MANDANPINPEVIAAAQISRLVNGPAEANSRSIPTSTTMAHTANEIPTERRSFGVSQSLKFLGRFPPLLP
jgi:hypothetical protein